MSTNENIVHVRLDCWSAGMTRDWVQNRSVVASEVPPLPSEYDLERVLLCPSRLQST